MTIIAVKKKKHSTDNPMYKSTDRSLLCNGCSGTLSKTQLFPACQVWWPRRSRTGSATDLSNSRHTRRARERQTVHTQCTSPWRTAIDGRGKSSALFETTSGWCWVKRYLILSLNLTKCTPPVRKATHVVQNGLFAAKCRVVYSQMFCFWFIRNHTICVKGIKKTTPLYNFQYITIIRGQSAGEE